jgi:hypothetical protein
MKVVVLPDHNVKIGMNLLAKLEEELFDFNKNENIETQEVVGDLWQRRQN